MHPINERYSLCSRPELGLERFVERRYGDRTRVDAVCRVRVRLRVRVRVEIRICCERLWFWVRTPNKEGVSVSQVLVPLDQLDQALKNTHRLTRLNTEP